MGVQAAHALEIPALRLGILTTFTNAWTFDADREKFSGRSFKIMSDVSLRLTGEKAIGGWLRPALVARYFYDHRTEPSGDFEGTFHGFGFGLGFSSE